MHARSLEVLSLGEFICVAGGRMLPLSTSGNPRYKALVSIAESWGNWFQTWIIFMCGESFCVPYLGGYAMLDSSISWRVRRAHFDQGDHERYIISCQFPDVFTKQILDRKGWSSWRLDEFTEELSIYQADGVRGGCVFRKICLKARFADVFTPFISSFSGVKAPRYFLMQKPELGFRGKPLHRKYSSTIRLAQRSSYVSQTHFAFPSSVFSFPFPFPFRSLHVEACVERPSLMDYPGPKLSTELLKSLPKIQWRSFSASNHSTAQIADIIGQFPRAILALVILVKLRIDNK